MSLGKTLCQRIVHTLNTHEYKQVFIDFSLTVKAVTLIFISGRCSAISTAKQEKSGSIYSLVKN